MKSKLFNKCPFFKAPDKRVAPLLTELQPPNIPKRGQKKSLGNITVENSLILQNFKENSKSNSITNSHSDSIVVDDHDLRDSGISMTDQSNLNNFNNTCYEDYELNSHQQEMNINSSPNEGAVSPKTESPPPIPPKSNLSLNSSFDFGGGSLERRKPDNNATTVLLDGNNAENYSEPKINNNDNGEKDTS